MKEIEDDDNGNLFPLHHRINPASLTQNEVAGILRAADESDLSHEETIKLLIHFRDKKRAACANKKKQ